MTDGEKEKIKLRASYLNGVALVFLSLGGLGPFFIAYQSLELSKILYSLIFLWVGGMSSWELHQMAQRQLSKLDQKGADDKVKE